MVFYLYYSSEMEGGKKIVPPPKGLVYSSTIVPPMASEPCLSSTLSAAISSFSSAGNYLLQCLVN